MFKITDSSTHWSTIQVSEFGKKLYLRTGLYFGPEAPGTISELKTKLYPWGGGTLIFSSYVSLGPASTVHQKYQEYLAPRGGGTLVFSLYVGSAQHLPFTPKKYQEFQAPQKIFEILATPNTVELWSLELACLEHQGSLELVRRSRQFPYTFNVKIHPRLEQ